MQTSEECAELARVGAKNAHLTSTKEVSRVLWEMRSNISKKRQSSITARCLTLANSRRGSNKGYWSEATSTLLVFPVT